MANMGQWGPWGSMGGHDGPWGALIIPHMPSWALMGPQPSSTILNLPGALNLSTILNLETNWKNWEALEIASMAEIKLFRFSSAS